MRGAATDRHFAVARTATRAVAVVGVVARAYNGRVDDAPRILPGPATGADAAGDVALGVDGDDVDRAVQVAVVFVAGGNFRVFGGFVDQFTHDCVAWVAVFADSAFVDGLCLVGQQIAFLEAQFLGESLSARAGQQHMRKAFHNL